MAGPLRLLAVAGYHGLQNDLIYKRCNEVASVKSNVVFFGGDVQDYVENMMAHRDDHRHAQWNLEATAIILSDAFPQSDILVVRPSRMYLRTFSCYDNFVKSSEIGVPSYDSHGNAFRHLSALLHSVTSILTERHRGKDKIGSKEKATAVEPNDSKHAGKPGDKETLILIGFSKGCVVLNQLVHEIHSYSSDEEMRNFVSSIKDIIWLDGGHPGGSKVWITDSQVLKSLAETGIRLHIHVTPYQIEDQLRPWIGKEEKLFTRHLKRLNASVTRTAHFVGETPSIEMHFKLLKEFSK